MECTCIFVIFVLSPEDQKMKAYQSGRFSIPFVPVVGMEINLTRGKPESPFVWDVPGVWGVVKKVGWNMFENVFTVTFEEVKDLAKASSFQWLLENSGFEEVK